MLLTDHGSVVRRMGITKRISLNGAFVGSGGCIVNSRKSCHNDKHHKLRSEAYMFSHPDDEAAGLEASDLDILVQLDLAAEAEPFMAVTLPRTNVSHRSRQALPRSSSARPPKRRCRTHSMLEVPLADRVYPPYIRLRSQHKLVPDHTGRASAPQAQKGRSREKPPYRTSTVDCLRTRRRVNCLFGARIVAVGPYGMNAARENADEQNMT